MLLLLHLLRELETIGMRRHVGALSLDRKALSARHLLRVHHANLMLMLGSNLLLLLLKHFDLLRDRKLFHWNL